MLNRFRDASHYQHIPSVISTTFHNLQTIILVHRYDRKHYTKLTQFPLWFHFSGSLSWRFTDFYQLIFGMCSEDKMAVFLLLCYHGSFIVHSMHLFLEKWNEMFFWGFWKQPSLLCFTQSFLGALDLLHLWVSAPQRCCSAIAKVITSHRWQE